jgi:hypothetical protein
MKDIRNCANPIAMIHPLFELSRIMSQNHSKDVPHQSQVDPSYTKVVIRSLCHPRVNSRPRIPSADCWSLRSPTSLFHTPSASFLLLARHTYPTSITQLPRTTPSKLHSPSAFPGFRAQSLNRWGESRFFLRCRTISRQGQECLSIMSSHAPLCASTPLHGSSP